MKLSCLTHKAHKVFCFYLFITLFTPENNVTMQEIQCDKSRQLFNTTWGIITSGPSGTNYTQDSHCEWLIKAHTKKYYITLSFQTMGTECSYDYLFVYDGDTLKSPLLGSFSGKTAPQQITSKSGSMLILLYSDANYVLSGFRAEFSVTKCPRNCTGHGFCNDNKCECETYWSGVDCSFEICPQNCSFIHGKGICTESKCECFEGYSGQACDLSKNDSSGNSWHLLSTSENGLSKRAAHTAVYVRETDSFYIFGGYDLNNILGDLSVYNFNRSVWEDQYGNSLVKFFKHTDQSSTEKGMKEKYKISLGKLWSKKQDFIDNLLFSNSDNFSESEEETLKLNKFPRIHSDKPNNSLNLNKRNFNSVEIINNQREQPSPRYGHAACSYPGGFVIYGGKTSNGSLSNELWFYNATSKKWSLRARFSVILPPKLTRHTLTLVQKDIIYLFGGSTVGGDFSAKLYSIKLNSELKKEQWTYVRPRGGKDFDLRLVAHTTVYSSKMDSLLVYGGIMAGLARLSKLSDRMFLFKISSRYWSEIHYPRPHISDFHIPRERAFHTSVILGNYFVVFGGYSHEHNKEEICYDNQMYLYHLGCHTWINHDVFSSNDKIENHKKQLGVFAHAADIRNGNTLLIVGGYHGNVNGDLRAYVLPPMLTSREGDSFEPGQICGRHRSLHECTSNPECGWCSADEICYGRTVGVNCTTNLQTTRCPGLCPALGDCHSCLIQGETPTSLKELSSSVAQKLKLGQCVWCVENGRCHHKDDNYGVCGLRENTLIQIPSWWRFQSTEITSVEECRTKDHRPGLTFLKYKHPINWSQPDSVTIINATSVNFDFPLKDAKSEILVPGGSVIARILGFLRIPREWLNVTETLKMCSSFSNTILRLSPNNSHAHLELVGNMSAETISCKTAYWQSGASVVLHPGRYLVDFQTKKLLTAGSGSYELSKMILMHNKSKDNSKVFTFEYLEPYQNGSCHSYSNCLQCLTDSLCGWCDLSGTCLLRHANESKFCRFEEDWRYLTIQPSACVKCSNYISCESCVSSDMCEWWIEEAKCLRRGSALFAAQTDAQCPVPCHVRKNCSQCLEEKGRCVWCEATKECFSFSIYTSEYQFGLCREWIDQNNYGLHQSYFKEGKNNFTLQSGQCKSCSKLTNCSTCLQTLSCGWCYELKNPTSGFCVRGDFSNPENGNCSSIIGEIYNKSLALEESGWSYAHCPDVDECFLKLHNCHPEAICTNTYGSFTCVCKRGFYGDGRHSCTKTCYNKCVHGTCTMAPHYQCHCNLGWTGDNCGIDCGCNNHSTCNYKVGVCDQCQDWTTGEFCQNCKSGSFGNATSELKCQKCQCNGHGDSALGFCDSVTGICFCKDNTEGDKCEKCKKGYYGNPANGGICYYECGSRGTVTAFNSQGIGSHRLSIMPWEAKLESNSSRECLWILNSFQLINSSHSSVIQLAIDGDISVKCEDNSVFVYEGLPDLVSLSYQNHALGTFCERDDKRTLTVETKSSTVTVFYKQGGKSEGFNASYNIFSCPHNCLGNRVCVENECVCLDGWTGPNCSLPICPNNCSFEVKQGVCSKGYGRCNCKAGYGSTDCSVKINNHQIIFTELFNSAKISRSFDHLRKMIPRFGHSLVIDRRGSLWMFGGYSLSHGPLNDIRLFDTKNNTWMQVTVDSTRDVSMPQGRYFHAAEIVHSRREIYVFGGIGTSSGLENDILHDFWKFSIKHQRWIDIKTSKIPPPTAGHSLTLMKDLESESLFLIGGFSPQNGFLSQIWYFNIENEQWDTLKALGKGPCGIYGHSAVYHAPTQSFYIYGGYLLSGNRRIYSSQLYSFHHPTKTWSPLPKFEEYNPASSNLPHSRFLHSAIATKEYMLLFGGKMFKKSSQIRFSDMLIAYSYSCNQWIRLLYRGAPVVGSLPPLTYAQAMTYDPESRAVYIVGGFDSLVHSDVTRINLPLDLCNLWEGKEKCRSFLGCSFCSVMKPDKSLTSYCYSSSKSLKESCEYYNGTLITNNGVVCDDKWFRHRSCEHFRTCTECLAKWPIYFNEQPACKWCSNCSRERCVSFNNTCWQDGKCEDLIDIEQCNTMKCFESDCKINGSCLAWNESNENSSKAADKISDCWLHCSDFRTCNTCLSNGCRWSTALKKCISPDFQPLFCAGGICGLVLKEENLGHCPQPCSHYNQCATCLKNSHCGWCSISMGNYSGEGVCTEGTLEKPLGGVAHNTCDELLSFRKFSVSSDSINWHYVSCPEENECLNGHHTCDLVSEVCKDLPQGFHCVCGRGYKFSEFECLPVCSQGCLKGNCVQPDKCLCDFGYVGANCSIQCQCNGHSNCAGPDRLNECLECHNNTKGAQCEHCKPLFVGNPTNNGKCVPCFEYCHQHTSVCINDSSKLLLDNKSINDLITILEEGPTTNALCIGCLNKTRGRKCDECMEGYFRGTEDLRQKCRPCECHGHGDRCDPVTGEKCNCANNTESECQTSISKNSNQQCWMLQCSKCKETYSGTPTDGHQCYKQMTLDHKFCLNSKLLEECKLKPKPLQPGQSAFFQVQPRYVNVDIRVFVDVMEGSLDLYMSLRDDSLIVLSNSSSGKHFLAWDSKYKGSNWSAKGFGSHPGNLKLPSDKKLPSSGNRSFFDSSSDFFFHLEKTAEGLTTYVTINKKNSFLHVRNIKGRLVLTLPKDKFDLISTRFYLGLISSAQGDAIAPVYGILFFRQDQLHIDLFVFFSVFFSCFFLFLAACVILWKAKQAADIRRARRRQVVEMLHMAKRPFAKVVLQLDSKDAEDSLHFYTQPPLGWKRNKSYISYGETRPVAIEPTGDGVAGIATFFVRLPGGSKAPVQLSLASSLITISRTYHINSRVFLRRRSSLHGAS